MSRSRGTRLRNELSQIYEYGKEYVKSTIAPYIGDIILKGADFGKKLGLNPYLVDRYVDKGIRYLSENTLNISPEDISPIEKIGVSFMNYGMIPDDNSEYNKVAPPGMQNGRYMTADNLTIADYFRNMREVNNVRNMTPQQRQKLWEDKAKEQEKVTLNIMKKQMTKAKANEQKQYENKIKNEYAKVKKLKEEGKPILSEETMKKLDEYKLKKKTEERAKMLKPQQAPRRLNTKGLKNRQQDKSLGKKEKGEEQIKSPTKNLRTPEQKKKMIENKKKAVAEAFDKTIKAEEQSLKMVSDVNELLNEKKKKNNIYKVQI